MIFYYDPPPTSTKALLDFCEHQSGRGINTRMLRVFEEANATAATRDPITGRTALIALCDKVCVSYIPMCVTWSWCMDSIENDMLPCYLKPE